MIKDRRINTNIYIHITLILGKTEGRKRRRRRRMRWLDGITDSKGMSMSKLREIVKDRKSGCCSP